MKIAIYGGAFNPVHLGHIQIVKSVQSKYDFNKILIIPSKISPHKSSDELVSAEHRLNMCKLAFKDVENCEVSDIEICCDGISYTYKTLEKLKQRYNDVQIYLICGSDMFLTLLNWKEYKKIFQMSKILAFARDNENIDKILDYKKLIEEKGACVELCKDEIVPYSSTQIRNAIKNNQNIEKFVCKEVFNYIKEHNFYKK